MTTSASPSPTPTKHSAAARAVDLRKVYGSGDTKVAALDGVSVEFRPGQFTAIMVPLRFRQVDAHALRGRRPRQRSGR